MHILGFFRCNITYFISSLGQNASELFLAMHQTISESGYHMKGLKECHPKQLKLLTKRC